VRFIGERKREKKELKGAEKDLFGKKSRDYLEEMYKQYQKNFWSKPRLTKSGRKKPDLEPMPSDVTFLC
jgi:hypothetical protein